MEWGKGDEQRDRNAHAEDGGGLEIAQEQVKHGDGQEPAEDGGVTHLANAAFDEDRAVGNHLERGVFLVVQPLGESGSGWRRGTRPGQAWRGRGVRGADRGAHGFSDGDDVGVGFLVDIDLDTFAAMGAGDHVAIALRAHHLGDVADAHLPAVNPEQNGLGDFVEVGVFVEGPDHVFGAPFFESATGDVDVFLAETVDDLLDGEPGADDEVLAEENMVFLVQTAADADGGDAGDRFESAFDLDLGQAPEPAQAWFALVTGAFAGECQFEDRIQGGIEVQEQWTFGLARQEHQVELFHGFLGGLGHVGAPEEFQDDVADTGAADAAELVETADDAQGLFDGAADLVFDLLGRGARVFGAHGQGRVGEVGHQGDRQPAEREEPEHHGRQEDHENRHRAVGGEVGCRTLLHHAVSGSVARAFSGASAGLGSVASVATSLASGSGSSGNRTLAPSRRPV